MEAIDRMTLWEYDLRMEAHNLKIVDMEYRIHLQAWMNRAVNAKKKKGKDGLEYIHKKFGKFFDYKKRLSEISEKKSKGISDEAKPMLSHSYAKYRKKGGVKDERI